MTHHLPTGHWDAPLSRNSMRSGAPIRSTCSPRPRKIHLTRFLPLTPADAAGGCAAAFYVDSEVENGWANPPVSFLPQVVARITSYPGDLTLVALSGKHQSWRALATRYCAARKQRNFPYPTFTVAGRTACSPPPVWRVMIFRFEKAHRTRVSSGATAWRSRCRGPVGRLPPDSSL